jgi:hypothetical protein
MRSTTKYEVGKAIAWLLIGLTVLPLVAANAEAREPADATERLAWLLAQHDVRELINMPATEQADCSASEEEDKR